LLEASNPKQAIAIYQGAATRLADLDPTLSFQTFLHAANTAENVFHALPMAVDFYLLAAETIARVNPAQAFTTRLMAANLAKQFNSELSFWLFSRAEAETRSAEEAYAALTLAAGQVLNPRFPPDEDEDAKSSLDHLQARLSDVWGRLQSNPRFVAANGQKHQELMAAIAAKLAEL